MGLFGKGDPPEEPVSRFFPVVTPSRRPSIEEQRKRNDSRKWAEKMWAEVLAPLQELARTQRYVK